MLKTGASRLLVRSKRDRALFLRAYAKQKNRIYGDELRAMARELEAAADLEDRDKRD